jgi:hypothetical protein
LAEGLEEREGSEKSGLAEGEWAERPPWLPEGASSDHLVIQCQCSNQAVGNRRRRSLHQMEATLLNRGVGGGTPPGADHFRHRLVRHLVTENQNQSRGDCECDPRAHGSPDPHELNAPIGGVIVVGSQGLGHTLADQHQAGWIHSELDQIFAN